MRVSYSGTRRPKPGASREDHALYERIEEDAIHDVMGLPPGTVVVHGAEPTGIDAAVGRAAREFGLVVEEHPPDVAAHGGNFAAAAMARNMYVTTVGADGEARFFASPTSRGTWDAFRKAERAGVRRRMRDYQRDGGVHVLSWPDLPPTRLRVRSGSLRGYTGPGKLDVTRGSGRGPGLAFAPTRAILDVAIAERHKAVELLRRADKLKTHHRIQLFAAGAADEAAALEAEAWRIEDAAWQAYVPQFLAEMRVSAGLRRSSPRWGPLEDAAVARGVAPQPEAWRELLAGKLGSYDVDGAPLTVACCWCESPFTKRDHCHARLLVAVIWPALGAEDGGEAKSAGVCHVHVRR